MRHTFEIGKERFRAYAEVYWDLIPTPDMRPDPAPTLYDVPQIFRTGGPDDYVKIIQAIKYSHSKKSSLYTWGDTFEECWERLQQYMSEELSEIKAMS